MRQRIAMASIRLVGFAGLMAGSLLARTVEAAEAAPVGEPTVAPYTLRVMRDGTEAEVFGGFKPGLARDFIALALKNPKLKTVHLTSGGGIVGEGLALARTIRVLRLDTYVPRECDSACTIAFAAGKRRWIDKDATLGFHMAKNRRGGAFSAALAVSPFSSIAMTYRTAGFSEPFIARATTTPHSELWRPSLTELRDSGVVTDVSDGSQFVWSGFPPDFRWPSFADGVAEAHPAFDSLRTHDTATYARLAGIFERGYADSRTRKAVFEEFGTALGKVVQKNWLIADDASMASLATLLADEYQTLGRKDAAACFRYAKGELTNGQLRESVPPELWTRHQKWQGAMIATAKPNAHARENRAAARKLYVAVVVKLGRKKIALLAADAVKPQQYAEYCEAITAQFRAIAQLGDAKSGPIMRAILRAIADDNAKTSSR